MEDKLGFIPSFRISSKLRGLFIEQCLPPEEGECGEGGIAFNDFLADSVEYKAPQDRVNNILIQRLKSGDMNTALADFQKLVGNKCQVKDKAIPPKIVKNVSIVNHPTLPKGTTVTVRNVSENTIQIDFPPVGDAKKVVFKVRYR